MPLSLNIDKRDADNARVRLSNLKSVNIRDKSYLYALFVLEEGRHMIGKERLMANAVEDIQHLSEIVSGARNPDATGDWYDEERRAHIARTLLSQAYLENIKKWQEAARIAIRRWRFNDESDEEPPELPKVGWKERDLIEKAIHDLGDAMSLEMLPNIHPIFTLFPSLREQSGEDQSGDDTSEETTGDEEESSDDDFEIVIRGSRINTHPSPGIAERESDEPQRMPASVPEVVTGFENEHIDDAMPPIDSESDSDSDIDMMPSVRLGTTRNNVARRWRTASSGRSFWTPNLDNPYRRLMPFLENMNRINLENPVLWDTPNLENPIGRFINGRYVE